MIDPRLVRVEDPHEHYCRHCRPGEFPEVVLNDSTYLSVETHPEEAKRVTPLLSGTKVPNGNAAKSGPDGWVRYFVSETVARPDPVTLMHRRHYCDCRQGACERLVRGYVQFAWDSTTEAVHA